VTRPCSLSAWEEWKGCNVATPYQKFRGRVVVEQAHGEDQHCNHHLQETSGCPIRAKEDPKPCLFNAWSEWSHCSSTCGGQAVRSRSLDASSGCSTAQGSLRLAEVQPCGPQSCEGFLSQWSEWSSCSQSCGMGMMTRSRSLRSSTGAGIAGQGIEALEATKACMVQPCISVDCRWGDWQTWSACSCTCGGGTKRRIRVIEQSPRLYGKPCAPQSKNEVAACHTQSCQVCLDGRWGEWDDWMSCSATCGQGVRVRHRDVEQRPNACGEPARGLEDEYERCDDLPSCVANVDCELSEWGEWSSCSGKCFGVRERSRNIARFAVGAGKSCVGDKLKEIAPCHKHPDEDAPADCDLPEQRACSMAAWAHWGDCSASCDGGVKTRMRHILMPNANGGEPCSAARQESAPCGQERCDGLTCVDCQWGEWSDWGGCSHCGGQRYRHRSIRKLPNLCGKACSAEASKEVGSCESSCGSLSYCSWTEWSEMSSCSATCGPASSMRQRQLAPLSEKPSTTVELLGVGQCLDRRGRAYTKKPVPSITKSECSAALRRAANDTMVRGAQFSSSGTCEFLVDAASDGNALSLKPSGVSTSGQLLYATGGQGFVEGTDGASGWLCWRTDPGVFFEGGRELPCSGSQIGLLSCNLTACVTCEPVDCVFGDWSEWAEPTCHELCERHRVVRTVNKCGGEICSGALDETKRCPREDCHVPQNCTFGDWGDWDGHCPDVAQRSRSRPMLHRALNGGEPCSGDLNETAPCAVKVTRSVDCEAAPWGSWSACSEGCGGGLRSRERKLAKLSEGHGAACATTALGELESCNAQPCDLDTKPCELGAWQAWSACSSGAGALRVRSRRITQPPGSGGKRCSGNLREVKSCTQVVDCRVSPWTNWDACTSQCGGGQKQRQRQVVQNPLNGGKDCPSDLVQTRGCNQLPCKNHSLACQVSDWSDWGQCSVSCVHLRNRSFTQMSRDGGKGCDMELSEVQACTGIHLACNEVDCAWADWSDWGGCTCSCGGGQRTRDRHIAKVPLRGGKPCEASNKEEVQPCSTQPCGQQEDCRDGEWEDWSEWEVCSATCEGGMTWRSRQVQTEANECGRPALGHTKEHRSCNADVQCEPAVDCQFNEWTDWSACTSECEGVKRRSRNIRVQGHAKGKFCEGPLKETSPCHENCGQGSQKPVDCALSAWQDWEACNVPCGRGEKTRSRQILEEGARGGHGCRAALMQVTPCMCSGECASPVDCTWGDWEEWGACDRGGERKRFRHITVEASCGGQPCSAKSAEEISNCTRRSHGELFCEWLDWRSWSDCSRSCGDDGRRSRERFLEAAPLRAEGGGFAAAGSVDFQAKFEEIRLQTHELETRRVQDLVASFALGCISFVAALAVAQRRSSSASSHRYTPISSYDEPDGPASRSSRSALLPVEGPVE